MQHMLAFNDSLQTQRNDVSLIIHYSLNLINMSQPNDNSKPNQTKTAMETTRKSFKINKNRQEVLFISATQTIQQRIFQWVSAKFMLQCPEKLTPILVIL